jgi:hypothetical protein
MAASFGALPLELVERVVFYLALADFVSFTRTSAALHSALGPRQSRAGAACYVRAALREWGPARALLKIAQGNVRDPVVHVPPILLGFEADMALCTREWVQKDYDALCFTNWSFRCPARRMALQLWDNVDRLNDKQTTLLRRFSYFLIKRPYYQNILSRAVVVLCERGDDATLNALLGAEILYSSALFAGTFLVLRTALWSGHLTTANIILQACCRRAFFAGYNEAFKTRENTAETAIMMLEMCRPGPVSASIVFAEQVGNFYRSPFGLAAPGVVRAAMLFVAHMEPEVLSPRDPDDPHEINVARLSELFAGPGEIRKPPNLMFAYVRALRMFPCPVAEIALFAHEHGLDFKKRFYSLVLETERAEQQNNMAAFHYLVSNILPDGAPAPHAPVFEGTPRFARMLADDTKRQEVYRLVHARVDSATAEFLSSAAPEDV